MENLKEFETLFYDYAKIFGTYQHEDGDWISIFESNDIAAYLKKEEYNSIYGHNTYKFIIGCAAPKLEVCYQPYVDASGQKYILCKEYIGQQKILNEFKIRYVDDLLYFCFSPKQKEVELKNELIKNLGTRFLQLCADFIKIDKTAPHRLKKLFDSYCKIFGKSQIRFETNNTILKFDTDLSLVYDNSQNCEENFILRYDNSSDDCYFIIINPYKKIKLSKSTPFTIDNENKIIIISSYEQEEFKKKQDISCLHFETFAQFILVKSYLDAFIGGNNERLL